MLHLTVDPNSAVRSEVDRDLIPVLFDEAPRVPSIGEPVLAVQPDDEGDGIAYARVEAVNDEHRLIYLRVDWNSFHWIERD